QAAQNSSKSFAKKLRSFFAKVFRFFCFRAQILNCSAKSQNPAPARSGKSCNPPARPTRRRHHIAGDRNADVGQNHRRQKQPQKADQMRGAGATLSGGCA
ncbi:MAG: hypothetical protein ACC646_11265, partial [Paracoccaceae bacterium]